MVIDLRKAHEIRRDELFRRAELMFEKSTVAQLAEAMKMARTHFYALQSGERKVNIDIENKLLDAMRKRVVDLREQADVIEKEADALEKEIYVMNRALAGYPPEHLADPDDKD